MTEFQQTVCSVMSSAAATTLAGSISIGFMLSEANYASVFVFFNCLAVMMGQVTENMTIVAT